MQQPGRWLRAFAVLGALMLCAARAAGADLICFVYVSPIGDAGWSYQHDQGRKQMEAALGGKVTTKYVENVPEGSDVVTNHTDSTSVVQAAEEKSKYALGYHSDMSRYGPKAQLTATTHQWGDFYTKAVSDVLAGTWKTTNVWGGMKDGMIKLAPLNPAIPADVKALVAKQEAEIKAGTLHPFAGPVVDQDGKTRVPAGRNMTDDELGKMDYYVEGVASKLPKN